MATPKQQQAKPVMYVKSKEVNINGKVLEVLVPLSIADTSTMKSIFTENVQKTTEVSSIDKQPTVLLPQKVTNNSFSVVTPGSVNDNFVKLSAPCQLPSFEQPKTSTIETLKTLPKTLPITTTSSIGATSQMNSRPNGGNLIRLVTSTQLASFQQPRMSTIPTLKTLPSQTLGKPTQPLIMLVPPTTINSNLKPLNTSNPGTQLSTHYIIHPNKTCILNPINTKAESNTVLLNNSNLNLKIVPSVKSCNVNFSSADRQINPNALVLNACKDVPVKVADADQKMQKLVTNLLDIAHSRAVPKAPTVRKQMTANRNRLNNNTNNVSNCLQEKFKTLGRDNPVGQNKIIEKPVPEHKNENYTCSTKSGLTGINANDSDIIVLSDKVITKPLPLSKNSACIDITQKKSESIQTTTDGREAKRFKLDLSETSLPAKTLPTNEDEEDDIQIINEISASDKLKELIVLDDEEESNINSKVNTPLKSNRIKINILNVKNKESTNQSQLCSDKSNDINLNAVKVASEPSTNQNEIKNVSEPVPVSTAVKQLFSNNLSDISSNLIQTAPIYKVPTCSQSIILNKAQAPLSSIPILPKDSVVRCLTQMSPYLPSSTSIASNGAVLPGTNTTFIIKGINTNGGNTTQLINSITSRPIMTSTVLKPCTQSEISKLLFPVGSGQNPLAGRTNDNISGTNLVKFGSTKKVIGTVPGITSQVATKIANSNTSNNTLIKTAVASVSLPQITAVSSQSTASFSNIVTSTNQIEIQSNIPPVQAIKTSQIIPNITSPNVIGQSTNRKNLPAGIAGSGFIKACFTVPVIDIAKKLIILPQGNVCYLDAENKLYKGNFTCRLPKPLDKPYLISCNFPEASNDSGENSKKNNSDQDGSKLNLENSSKQKFMNISIFYKMDPQSRKDPSLASKTLRLPSLKSRNKDGYQLSLNSCYSYKKCLIPSDSSESSEVSVDSSSSDSDDSKPVFCHKYGKKAIGKKTYSRVARSPRKAVVRFQDSPDKGKNFDTDSGNSCDIDFNLFVPEVELIEEEDKKVNIPYISSAKSPRRMKITNRNSPLRKFKTLLESKAASGSKERSRKRKIQFKKRGLAKNKKSKSPKLNSNKKSSLKRSIAAIEEQITPICVQKKSKPIVNKPPVYPSLLNYCSVLLDPLDMSVIKDGSIDLQEVPLEDLFVFFNRNKSESRLKVEKKDETSKSNEIEKEIEELPPILTDMKKELEESTVLQNDVEEEENPPILTDMMKELKEKPSVSVKDFEENIIKDTNESDLQCLVYKTEKFTHLIPLTNVISLPNQKAESEGKLIPDLGETLPKSRLKISSIPLSSCKSLVSSSTEMTTEGPSDLEISELQQKLKSKLSKGNHESIDTSNKNSVFLNDFENSSQHSSDSDFPSVRIQKLREKFLKNLAEVEKITKGRNST